MKVFRRVLTACAVAAVLGIAAGGAWMWHAGYGLYAIRTGSMSPGMPPGDAVLVRPAAQVHPGQVITFHPAPGATVTHRVASVNDEGIQTKGDANRTPDVWRIPQSDVVGTRVLHIPYGGYVAVFLQQPTGVASVVLCILGIAFAWQLFFGSVAEESAEPSRASGRHRRRRARQSTNPA